MREISAASESAVRTWRRWALAATAGYLLGTVPSADIASRLSGRGTAVRDEGSRNPGATNAAQVLGPWWGGAVLATDVSKGLFGAVLGRALAEADGCAIAATAAVLGHCYPVVFGRAGGKGVATRYGTLTTVAPRVTVIDLTIGAAVATIARRSDVAIGASVGCSVLAAVALTSDQPPCRRIATVLTTAVTGGVVLLRFAAAHADPRDKGRPHPSFGATNPPRSVS